MSSRTPGPMKTCARHTREENRKSYLERLHHVATVVRGAHDDAFFNFEFVHDGIEALGYHEERVGPLNPADGESGRMSLHDPPPFFHHPMTGDPHERAVERIIGKCGRHHHHIIHTNCAGPVTHYSHVQARQAHCPKSTGNCTELGTRNIKLH